MNPSDPILLIGLAIVSALYSSVGHGGATGYLALLTFSTLATKEASVLALGMNLVVSSIAFFAFQRAKHFDWQLTWPFLAGSIPFAFIGGKLKLPGNSHEPILAAVLVLAAIVLLFRPASSQTETKSPNLMLSIGIGAGIGLLSGIVGIGGGVFLSPIVLLAGFADAKKTASLAALFIFANSLSGLAARDPSSLKLIGEHWELLAVGAIGALAGSYLGAFRIPNVGLRRLLGLVLLVAVAKIFFG